MTTLAAKAPSRTVHSIQFLRFVAATVVVLFHSSGPSAKFTGVPLSETAKYLFGFGAVGVHLFFVISGFVMIYTVAGQRADGFSAATFFRNRIIRIYPIYLLCAALYVMCRFALGDPYQLDALQYAGAALLLPGSAPLIIGPGWTLSYEIYFYLIFGLAMIIGIARGLVVLSVLFALCVGLGFVLKPTAPWADLMTNALLLEFITGAWIGYLFSRRRAIFDPIAVPALLLSVVGFAGGIILGYDRVPTAIIWGVPSAVFLIGLLGLESRQRSPRFVRQLSFLGDSSYALYLIHVLAIDLLLHGFAVAGLVEWPARILPFVIAVLCVFIGIGLHNFAERPMLRAIRSTITRGRGKPSAHDYQLSTTEKI